MSGKVLCAVDISHPEQNKALLQRADQLATLDQAELDVVSVVPGFGSSMVGTFFPEGTEAKILDAAKESLHNIVREALGADADQRIQHIIAEGTVYEEILRTAKEVEASLIVIGSHRPDLKDFLIGPNASRVCRHADCSVYVMRL